MRCKFLTVLDLGAREGDGGDGGQGGDGGEGGQAAGLLNDGAGDGGQGGDGGGEFTIPEKFLVKNEAGEVDHLAVLKKALPAYTHLEKRLGSGEAPPKSAEEYKLEPYLPEGSAMPPESEKRIFGDMHALGLNNKQLQGVMGLFGNLLGEGMAQEKATAEASMATLKQVWPEDSEYKANMALANHTLKMVAPAELYNEIVADKHLQSKPAFIRLLALFGDEFKEDTSREHMDDAAAESITTLKRSEAYLDIKHPDHKSVVAQVTDAYSKGYKEKK